MEPIYLMIDRRSMTGNSVIFWAKNHRGYTSNPDKAHHFDEKEARAIEGNRSTDCAIPLSEAIQAQCYHVDFQGLDRKYFHPAFNYFSSDQQKSDSEKEIERLRLIINEIKNVVAMSEEYRFDSEELLEQINAIEKDAR